MVVTAKIASFMMKKRKKSSFLASLIPCDSNRLVEVVVLIIQGWVYCFVPLHRFFGGGKVHSTKETSGIV